MTREEALKSFEEENKDFEKIFERYGYQMSPEEVSAVKEAIERNKVAISALSENKVEDSPKGHWIESKQTKGKWYCSECGGIRNDPESGIWREVHDYKPFFCPNCGADMRGDKFK